MPKVEKPATKEVPVKGAKNGEKRVVPVQHTVRLRGQRKDSKNTTSDG